MFPNSEKLYEIREHIYSYWCLTVLALFGSNIFIGNFDKKVRQAFLLLLRNLAHNYYPFIMHDSANEQSLSQQMSNCFFLKLFFLFAPQLNIKYLRKKLHKEYEMYPK